jgi:alanine racemase
VAEGLSRPAWAEIDLEALRRNVEVLRAISSPAGVCAVVKADAYGHGAVPVARAALDAGVSALAVALVDEGIELREAEISAPILLLSEPPPDAVEAALAQNLTATIYSDAGAEAVSAAAVHLGARRPVHVKVDTGMHRLGLEPDAAGEFAQRLDTSPLLTLEGFWTHLAVADGASEEDRAFTDTQIDRFELALTQLERRGIRPQVRHVANSAGAIAHPRARFDMVRTGIALYGEQPSAAVASAMAELVGRRQLEPVLSLRAQVAAIRWLEAGERPSYGRRRPLPRTSIVATVPLGYADGVPRRFFETGGEVLIGGRRRPLAGTVTMDQIIVDCGAEGDVAVGDEVVLIGRQGTEQVTAGEWAERLGTISYEVLTGIGPRVPRIVRGEDMARRGRRRAWA